MMGPTLSEIFRKFQPQFKDLDGALEGYSRLHTGLIPEIRLERKTIMKSQVSKQISTGTVAAVLVLAGVLALMGQTASAQAAVVSAAKQLANGRNIVGTWQVRVQLYDCATEAPIGPTFVSLLTFNEGGTMTGSTSNPGFAVGQRGPDAGVWERNGRHTYNAKSIALLNYTTPPNLPLNPGFLAGTQTLTQKIRFDNPDEFTSDATTEFFDVDGDSYRKGCASAVAQRLGD
jgi:hypothetical protein